MAYIYKITNRLNNEVYVGKTLLTPEKRFQQHLRDAYKDRNENRPLYRAIRKYGETNFELSIIEHCSDKEVNEREIYWIDYYHSFSDGYNATVGGDGKHFIDYDKVVAVYQETQNMSEVARQLNISTDSVKNILTEREIPIKDSTEIVRQKYGKPISQYDLEGNFIQTFVTLRDAGHYLKDNNYAKGAIQGVFSHVRDVAHGKRKTAYGFVWKWANI